MCLFECLRVPAVVCKCTCACVHVSVREKMCMGTVYVNDMSFLWSMFFIFVQYMSSLCVFPCVRAVVCVRVCVRASLSLAAAPVCTC